MKVVPIKNTVLCKKIKNENDSSIKGILILNKKEVDTYKIISVSSDDDEYIFKPDDEIIVFGSGDLIEQEKKYSENFEQECEDCNRKYKKETV